MKLENSSSLSLSLCVWGNKIEYRDFDIFRDTRSRLCAAATTIILCVLITNYIEPRVKEKCISWSRKIMDDETLNRLAAEALMEEAKVGARRAEIMGPSGWIKPRETINKRFLHSTLRNVVMSNRHKQQRRDKKNPDRDN